MASAFSRLFSCIGTFGSTFSSQDVFDPRVHDLVPRLFMPLLHPSRLIRDDVLAQRRSCRNRIALFAEAMGWDISQLSEQLPLIQDRISAFEQNLRTNRPFLSNVLLKLRLIENPLLPNIDFLGDLDLYAASFSRAAEAPETRSIFRVLLADPENIQHIIKLAVLVRYENFRNIGLLAPRFCALVSSALGGHGGAETASGRFQEICAGDVPGSRPLFLKFFEALEVRELQYLLSEFRSLDLLRGIVAPSEDILDFIRDRNFRLEVGDAYVEMIRAIPPEVHPQYRNFCLQFKVALFCQKVTDRFEDLNRSIANFGMFIAGLRDNFKNVWIPPSVIETSGIEGMDVRRYVDLLGEETEADSELKRINPHIIRIFAIAAETFPDWPLLERLAAVQDQENRQKQIFELLLVAAGPVGAAMRVLREIFENVHIESMRQALRGVDGQSLVKLYEAGNAESYAEEAEVLVRDVAIGLEKERDIGRFIQKRIGERGADEDVCCMCLGESLNGKVVEFCEGKAHWSCEGCALQYMRSLEKRVVCPICRELILSFKS